MKSRQVSTKIAVFNLGKYQVGIGGSASCYSGQANRQKAYAARPRQRPIIGQGAEEAGPAGNRRAIELIQQLVKLIAGGHERVCKVFTFSASECLHFRAVFTFSSAVCRHLFVNSRLIVGRVR